MGPARNVPKPELPEAAKQNTKEGFAAFTQYWFDTITYGRESGDLLPLRNASLDSCKMCQFQIEKAAQIHSGGGWSSGPRRQVQGFEANMSLDPNNDVVGYFFLDESRSVTYAKDRSIIDERAGSRVEGSQVIYARFADGKWSAAEAGRA